MTNENTLDLAVLIPTRNRPVEIDRLITNIAETAECPDKIEIMIGFDDDDPASCDKQDEWRTKIESYGMLPYLMRTDPCGAAQVENMLSCRTPADILMYAADDIKFVTQGWDKKILDFFWESDDRIWLTFCFNSQKAANPFPDHGFISRWGRNASGYVFPHFATKHQNAVSSFHISDIWLAQLYAMIGRLHYFPEIIIEHEHWSNGKKKMDDSYFRSAIAQCVYVTPELDAAMLELPKHAAKLQLVIDYVKEVGREHALEQCPGKIRRKINKGSEKINDNVEVVNIPV